MRNGLFIKPVQGKFSEFGQLSVSSFQTYHGHPMITSIYYRYAQQYLNV